MIPNVFRRFISVMSDIKWNEKFVQRYYLF
jgi:hypothetical protein